MEGGAGLDEGLVDLDHVATNIHFMLMAVNGVCEKKKHFLLSERSNNTQPNLYADNYMNFLVQRLRAIEIKAKQKGQAMSKLKAGEIEKAKIQQKGISLDNKK